MLFLPACRVRPACWESGWMTEEQFDCSSEFQFVTRLLCSAHWIQFKIQTPELSGSSAGKTAGQGWCFPFVVGNRGVQGQEWKGTGGAVLSWYSLSFIAGPPSRALRGWTGRECPVQVEQHVCMQTPCPEGMLLLPGFCFWEISLLQNMINVNNNKSGCYNCVAPDTTVTTVSW